MDFGKNYTKIPITVTARQWTPYSEVPFVDNLYLDVVDPNQPEVSSDNILQQDVNKYFNGTRMLKVCYKGMLRLDDKSVDVMPLDWVLFMDKKPLMVMKHGEFSREFSDGFELCQTCKMNSQLLPLMQSLEAGRTVTLSDGTQIKSIEELKIWAANNGVTL